MKCLYCGGDMEKHFIGEYDYEGEPFTMLRCSICHKYEGQWLIENKKEYGL